MPIIPTPRSFNRIMGDLISAFLSRFGLKTMRVGSPALALMEAAAQSDLRTSQDIFQLLNSDSIDRATGTALDRIGLSEDAPRLTETPASGVVSISDTSFAKISSKVYQGLAAPIIGTTVLNIADATSFPASGSVYIGRNTSNYEGPIAYAVAPVNNGTFWTITLSTGTKKFHNVGESIILAQGGNRLIAAGTSVQTAQGNALEAIQFSTQFSATIPDGETSIAGVSVVAKKTGVVGNVPAGAINAFSSLPFSGASVTNPLPYSNAQSGEDDPTYRERIKNIKASRSKGTALAIQTAVIGITSPDENKRVQSASVVTRQGFPTTLYIDDGTGYEEQSTGISSETVVDSALGGELYLQLASKKPITKAFIKTANSAPFAVPAGSKLAVKVAGVLYTHSFVSTDFRSVLNATAYEVVASINADSTIGFSARTGNSGTTVVLFAKTETGEDIEVVAPSSGVDANTALLFPLGRNDTVKLYKNDRLLSKDGRTAAITSTAQSTWNTMSSGETLVIAIDGTAAVTYTFNDADFVSTNTAYSTLSNLNSIDAWVAVFNAKIPGITASNTSGTLTLVSNAGSLSRAALSITGGTLVSKGMFTSVVGLTATGAGNDYTFNRNTGQLALTTSLSVGDTLAAGSASTRAFVQTPAITTIDITQSGGAQLWFVVDGNAQIIPHGLTTQTTLTFSTAGLFRARMTATGTGSAAAFSNVQTGDWAVLWDQAFLTNTSLSFATIATATTFIVASTANMFAGQPVIIDQGLNSEVLYINLIINGGSFNTTSPAVKAHAVGVPVSFGNQGAWRVQAATATYIELERGAPWAQSTTLPSLGVTFVRTLAPIQPIVIPPGVGYSVGTLISQLNSSLMGATSTTYKTSQIRMATNEFGSSGDIAMVAASSDGAKLGLAPLSATKNLSSHIAAVESGSTEFGTPTFVSTVIASTGAPVFGGSPTSNMAIQPGAGLTSGMQIVGLRDKPESLTQPRYSSNKGFNSPILGRFVSPPNIFFYLRNQAPSHYVNYLNTFASVAATGRVAVHSALALGPSDNLSITIDNDTLTKRYTFNTYRRIKPTTSTYGQTNAFKDLDNSTTSLAGAFGLAFNWQDFAVFMKARAKTHDSDPKAVLWRYYLFGPGGDNVRMQYTYPTTPSASVRETVDASTNSTVDVRVYLPSGSLRSLPNIRSTTGFGLVAPTAPSNGINTYWYVCGFSVSTASRTTNVVSATVTIPYPAQTNPWLNVGDSMYFKDTSGLFGSAVVTLLSVNTGTRVVTFNLPGADVGATGTPGTLSMDIAEASFTGSGIVAGDVVTVNASATFNVSTPTSNEQALNGFTGSAYMGKTMRVLTVGPQFISAKTDSSTGVAYSDGNFYTAGGSGMWRLLGPATDAIQFYPLANNLNTQVATATQSLVGAPIVGTALGGSAALTLATWDEANNATTWINFSDAINYISSVALYPILITDDYQLTFKDTVSGTLAGGSLCDWQNEELRLVPITVAGLVSYLSQPAVTGLSTVAAIQSSAGGDKLQIASQTIGSASAVQVSSGTASVATAPIQGSVPLAASGTQLLCQINQSDSAPFFGGMFVALNNTSGFVKSAAASAANFANINSAGVLDAQITGGVTNQLWAYSTSVADSLHGYFWQFEKQGKFVAITSAMLNPGEYPDLNGVSEGDMVIVDPPTSWQASVTFNTGTQTNLFMRPATVNGHFYQRSTATTNVTGGTEPVWSLVGGTVVDNGITWLDLGLDLASVSAPNQGMFRVVRVDNNTTTLNGLHGIGTGTFNVISTSGLYAGMIMRFEPTTANAEFLTINTIVSSTQFTTTATSVNSHASGTRVAGPNKTIWIENANAVEEVSAANLTFFNYFASALPGDKIVNSLSALGNIGTWIVKFPSYKHNFSTALTGYTPRNQYEVVLDTSTKTPVTTAAGNTANGGLVQIQDPTPARLIKRVVSLSPNKTDSTKMDMKFDTIGGSALISASLGTVVSALDKLNFPTTTSTGIDGYSFSTGIIGEAARVVYGDDQNTSAYPGVIAAGSVVTIAGPLVKRIQISLSVRIRTGVTAADVTDKVKNAVAGVINQTKVGQAIAISDLVSAAGSVNGVIAVSVISPAYNLGSDLISVQPFEKPLVQNLDTDVLVSIVGA
jgi:hypothetical protein